MADRDDTRPRAPELPTAALPSTQLDVLLEQATAPREARASWPRGATVVGECIDTHNPHVPMRVLVRARDETGKQVCEWLATIAELRVRPGQRVLLSQPDNWPEPIVVGVIAGGDPLATSEAEAAKVSTHAANLAMAIGQAVTLVGPDGAPLVELEPTADGLRLRLLADRVELDGGRCLRLGAERIELNAGEGGVDIRTDGEAIVRGRFIRLN